MSEESKGKIEIIQTGATTAKVILNGQDISNVVTSYTITHEANHIAKLELIVGKNFTGIKLDETCEVSIR